MLEKLQVDLPEALRSVLNEDEKVVYFNQKGLFGGNNCQLITDRRIIEIEKEGLKERNYLKDGEQVLEQALSGGSMTVHGRNEQGKFGVYGDIILITNQRLILFREKYLIERLEYEIPLGTIDRIHFSRIEPRGLFYGLKMGEEAVEILLSASDVPCSFLAHVFDIERLCLSVKPQHLQYSGVSDYRMNLEAIARKICEATGLPLSPPERFIVPSEFVGKEPKDYLTGTVLEFYTRTDLVWPERCAGCQGLADEYQYAILKLNIDGNTLPDHKRGIEYKVPYCEPCFVSRNLKPSSLFKPQRPAVKKYGVFRGINAFVWYEDKSYAMEFIRVNTRP